MKWISTFLILTLLMGGCRPSQEEAPSSGVLLVEVSADKGSYQLLVNGEPFQIKGAGLEFGPMDNLARHGGNAFRTWRTENGQQTGQEVLDEALRHGLKVAMCLEVERERHGFDYDDPQQVEEQFNTLSAEVLKYKDHPALLVWIIGNELNLEATNPKVWDAVNELSKFIHEVDPNHPTTTTLAGFNQDLADQIRQRATDLDFISIQMYGDLDNLPRYLDEIGWEGPYMITEWGSTGHWEMPTTEWGAPIENTSTEKARNYQNRYEKVIAPDTTQLIGNFVFLWEQKQERTPTWYGLFLDTGEETEAVEVLHHAWNGEWPANRSPRLDSLRLDGKSAHDNIRLKPGKEYSAQVYAEDYDKDPLEYRWEIKPESTDLQSGGDFEETPPNLPDLVAEPFDEEVTITTPEKSGPYRLFIYVFDGKGHAAHANVPFFVEE